MSVIKVRIPSEIEDYQEKVVLGLSIRELICCILGIGIAIPISIMLYIFKLSQTLIMIVSLLIGVIVYLFGFYKKNTFRFEEYLQIITHHYFSKNKLSYATELWIEELDKKDCKEVKKSVWKKRKKGPTERTGSTKEAIEERNKSVEKRIKAIKKCK